MSSNGSVSSVKSFKPQNTLNEITNKVFNELLQQKVDIQSQNTKRSHSTPSSDSPQNHSRALSPQRLRSTDADEVGMRSDEWSSETSSNNFSHLRQVDTKTRPSAMGRHRRYAISPSTSKSMSASAIAEKPIAEMDDDVSQKPLIAVWKTGAKLQNTSTSGSSASTEGNGNYSPLPFTDPMVQSPILPQICWRA